MTVTADTNPELLNAMAQKAMAAAPTPDVTIDESSLELPETEVTLPGGYITEDGVVATEAQVRELTGADEEVLAKCTTVGRALLAILERGTVSIGSQRATKEILDDVLAGDRDALLLAIRRATFGRTVTYQVTCGACDKEQDVEIDLVDDVETVRMDDPYDRKFVVQCRAGDIEVTLPTGRVHRDLMSQPDKTIAEQGTMLLAACVVSVAGFPSMGARTVQKLGIRDREKIMEEIAKRQPGPRLTTVKAPCLSCEEELIIPVTLTDLFRL